LNGLLVLGAALAAPLASLGLIAPISRRFHRARRFIGLFWHLLTISLWSILALGAGHPPGHERSWDTSHMALVMAAGLLYTETLFLLSLRGFRDLSRREAAQAPDRRREDSAFPSENVAEPGV
jgi:hypothetical protein